MTVTPTTRRIVVIDDDRTLALSGAAHWRTSADGLAELERLHAAGEHIDELWLDHDLGGDDTIRPVALWLAERAVWDDPVSVGLVCVHTANNVAGPWIVSTLGRWYPVRRVALDEVAALNALP